MAQCDVRYSIQWRVQERIHAHGRSGHTSSLYRHEFSTSFTSVTSHLREIQERVSAGDSVCSVQAVIILH